MDAILDTTRLNPSLQHSNTNTFRALTLNKLPDEPLFHEAAFIDWHTRWQLRLDHEATVERSDFTVLERLLIALKTPYDDSPSHRDYKTPPAPSERAYQTFCGT